MADGKECVCAARDEGECGCGADWTPSEVYEFREKVETLELEIVFLRAAMRTCSEFIKETLEKHNS